MWVTASAILAQPWIGDIGRELGSPILAWGIVCGVALIPGFANAFILVSLILDTRPQYRLHKMETPISVLIAAYNEEAVIAGTLESIAKQNYGGLLTVIVIDDGSSDNTTTAVHDWVAKNGTDAIKYVVLNMPKNGGKSAALNYGLNQVDTEYTLTIDADTYLFKDSLNHIVANIVNGPENTAAVAGAILARNSRKNWLTKMQEFDYFLGIGVVKRTQSLFQGTLVAQGAHSIYRTELLRDVGGWPEDCVGEDIVVTWAMINKNYRIGYAENAFAFTNVPEDYKTFYNQRERWSRGLIEAFKRYPKTITTLRKNSPFIFLNLLFPITDLFFMFVFVPSMILAIFFQSYLLVGGMTVLLLPLALLVNIVMFYKERSIFKDYDLNIRKNILGAIMYSLFYQIIMCPATISGYWKEILKIGGKSWGTK